MSGDGNTSGGYIEWWSLEIRHGDVMTLLLARNMTDDNGGTSVDYTFNVHYYVGGTLYIAQFMMMYVTFVSEEQHINAPFSTCDGFNLTFTPAQYVGTTPTLWCNITYEGIQVYQDQYPNSTFDLTLYHHIVADWNEMNIKVKAMVDLSDIMLINSSNDMEFKSDEPYTVEVHYRMLVHKANSNEGLLTPTGRTNISLEYKLTTDGGFPLTISKMNMDNEFSVVNGSGPYTSLAYYSIGFGIVSEINHGFHGLIYNDTLSIKSDPEVTVFHDRVTI